MKLRLRLQLYMQFILELTQFYFNGGQRCCTLHAVHFGSSIFTGHTLHSACSSIFTGRTLHSAVNLAASQTACVSLYLILYYQAKQMNIPTGAAASLVRGGIENPNYGACAFSTVAEGTEEALEQRADSSSPPLFHQFGVMNPAPPPDPTPPRLTEEQREAILRHLRLAPGPPPPPPPPAHSPDVGSDGPAKLFQ